MRVPSEAEESARDLVRAREDARGDLMRARHRLSKLLLRQGLVWENSAWTGAHEAWLRTLRFDRTGVQVAFDEAFDAVLNLHARRDRLVPAIAQIAATSAFAPVVQRLRCLRGIGTVTDVRARGRNRGTGTVHRVLDRLLLRAGAHRVLQRPPARAGRDHQDRTGNRSATRGA